VQEWQEAPHLHLKLEVTRNFHPDMPQEMPRTPWISQSSLGFQCLDRLPVHHESVDPFLALKFLRHVDQWETGWFSH
jgi:hypothetical protein